MELISEYKLMYEKSVNESDTIRQIIKLHTLDVLYGDKREGLNYVDVLYPAIEGLFGVDVCVNALSDKNVLREFYESYFDTETPYDEFQHSFDEARKTCDRMQSEETLLNVCNIAKDEISKLSEKRKNKIM